MVGTEKTADYKSAGTTQLLDETTIAKNEIGRLQICRNMAQICQDNGETKETTQRMVGRNKYCTGTEGVSERQKRG